jgi:hypothetical protein
MDFVKTRMHRTREQIRETPRTLRDEYGKLYDSLLALLFRADPVGINFEDNTDEYGPAVDTILPRLRTCNSADDVLRVVHEEFIRLFDEAVCSRAAASRALAPDNAYE